MTPATSANVDAKAAELAAEQERQHFEEAVAKEALSVRVRAEARRRVEAETMVRQPFDAALLGDIEDEVVRFVVQLLLTAGGRLLLSALRKTGKTTWILNLIRYLILGGNFLGRFYVEPIARRIALLNFEVSRSTCTHWARAVGIPGDRLLTVHLRGRRNPFASPDDTARLAELLHQYDVGIVFVDPFGRAYTGKSQNDPGEVAAWLSDLDRFAENAGCSEVILTAHSGWDGERTRGASALEDWADTVAYLVRDKEDERVRFFRAFGRDVEIEEDRLDYDPTSRLLTLAGTGNRTTARTQRRMEDLIVGILEAVTVEPGATTGRLEVLLREAGVGFQRGDVGRAARAAEQAGKITRIPGTRRSQRHYLRGQEGECSRLVPTSPAGSTGVLPRLVPTPPIGGGTSAVLLDVGGKPVVPPGLLTLPPRDREPGDDDEVLP